jgi:hypothetical protein
MTDDRLQPNVNGRPETAKLDQMGQPVQQSQANAAELPSQPVTPGRKPLFRN